MGKLIPIHYFHNGIVDKNLYFPYNMSINDGIAELYKYRSYIHFYDIGDENLWKISLRKYVERQATGDLILSKTNNNYFWFYNIEPEYDYQKKYYYIENYYYVLNFELEEDLIQFILINSDIVSSEIHKLHPDHRNFTTEEIEKRYRTRQYY